MLFRSKQAARVSGGHTKRVLLGLKMSEPIKRVGCSNLKTLIERDKLVIHDFLTISELSTFTQQGATYKAEDGYHDDLVMTLVSFAWLAAQKYFREANNTDIRQNLVKENEETDWLSFGFVGQSDEVDEPAITVEDDALWIPVGKTMTDVLQERLWTK